MIEVRVAGVAIDASEQHVILLGRASDEDSDGPMLPIWVGALEANSILLGAGQLAVPRPLTHDLMLAIIDSLDATVSRVEITNVDDGTFFAVIHLTSLEREHIVDSRPSDAIALAIRSGAPIFVSDDVFAGSSVSQILDLSGEREADAEGEGKDFQRFQEFLENVNPDDFKDNN